MKPNTANGLCIVCAAREPEHTLEFTSELGHSCWGVCAVCAGKRIAQVSQIGSNFKIDGTALENIMAKSPKLASAKERLDRAALPRNEDLLVITRGELGGMISAALYAAKAADKAGDADAEAQFMEVLAGVRKALGRPVSEDADDADEDDEELGWDDEDEESLAGSEDDEELDWDDDDEAAIATDDDSWDDEEEWDF